MPVLLVTAVAPLAWGTTYAVTSELLPPDRPLTAALLRALPAGLLLLAVTRRLPSGVWWLRAAVLGSLNIGLFFALLFVAAYRLPGGVAATVGAVQPLLVVLLSAGLLGELLTRRAVLAGLIGAGGVALLVLRGDAAVDAVGVAAAAGGAAVMALGVVLTKRWGRPASALTVTSWQLVAGGLLLLPLALVVEGPLPAAEVDAAAVGGYVYLGVVGTAVAYALWFRGLAVLPASSVSFLSLLAPVVATGVGWALLAQPLSAVQLSGAALVLLAVLLGQRRPGGTAVAAASEPVAAGRPNLQRDPQPLPRAVPTLNA